MSKQRAKQVFIAMLHETTQDHNPMGVHLSHCFTGNPMNFGGYKCCKYGDKYCPADPKWKKVLKEVTEGEQNIETK